MAAEFTCRICGASAKMPAIIAREMMIGTRDEFEYRQCPTCGCLQIAEYPPDVSKYYPSEYYSFGAGPRRAFGRLEAWLRRRRARRALGARDPVGFALTTALGVPECYRWMRPAGVEFTSRILDVGCGEGRLLAFLREEGFTALEGVDPHARDELRVQPGFVIHPSLVAASGTFDFVLLSHSLEHMRDQAGVFRDLRRVCHERTSVCIRIPVASHAFRTYGADWAQLDAPRHFYLHTRKSLEKLAQGAGFRIRHMHCDSTAFQFWASEQYRIGVALHDRRSHLVTPRGPDALFSRRRIRAWEREARALNRADDGDQAIFYLGIA